MENLKELDKLAEAIIAEYPAKRSAAMMLMHAIQERFGYFDDDAVLYVASKLDIEPIAAYGILSFYPMYSDSPRGRVHIKVCRTLSCALAGSIELAENISKLVGCEIGETKGVYTLEFVECIGNCSRGANVQINDKLFDKVKPEEAEKFVEMIKTQASELEAKSSLEAPQGADFNDPAFKG